MNIKLHQNKIFDTAVIAVDIFLVLLSSKLSERVLRWPMDENALEAVSISLFIATICYVCCIIFMLYTYEFYTKTIRAKFENLLSVAITVLISTFLTVIVQFVFSSKLKPAPVLFFLLMPVFLFVFIASFKMILLYIEKKIEGSLKLLVIESKDVENSLAKKIKYSYLDLYESWYVLIDVNDQGEIDSLINETFKEYESIFISPDIPVGLRDSLISKAVEQNKTIYLLPDFYGINIMNNETVQFDDTPALKIKPYGLSKMQRFIKRAFDIVVSLTGLLIALPIFVVVPIMIKLDSKGPVIYKQPRVTRDQKDFNVYKFRTMHEDAEKYTGAVLATENDPRITKVGRLLRSMRIDELPQLLNILLSHMSVVGPRPERTVFVEQYLKTVENYDKRFFVKAGLTGLAQVYARYDTSVDDKVLYDLIYIRDYSFFKDIKIVLLTVKTVFVRENAKGVQEKPWDKNDGMSV
ncbi:MAG: sugar transferase [Firmicutes bacterium]|nr:sugar transferase [Bacillota bacterium]